MNTFLSFLFSLSSVTAYLNSNEISILNELFVEWNGEYWTDCQWNMTQINNINENNYINDQCGLYFNNYTTYQYVDWIYFPYQQSHNITGTIPSSIKKLSNMTIFYLEYTELHGEIPETICDIISLQRFVLVGNNFTGSVPFCLFDLPSLEVLELFDTSNLYLYSSNMEQLCNNTNIHDRFWWLQLHNIHYIGNIPTCIGNTLYQLRFIQFSKITELNGYIPTSINNLTYLIYIIFQELPSINHNIQTIIHLPNLLTV
eukprot:484073_1